MRQTDDISTLEAHPVFCEAGGDCIGRGLVLARVVLLVGGSFTGEVCRVEARLSAGALASPERLHDVCSW